MMNKSPELMFRALTLHNNIIRKAKWVNCGFTLEQEGDSYALVFHDPRDAVGFCLQVGVGGWGGLCFEVGWGLFWEEVQGLRGVGERE